MKNSSRLLAEIDRNRTRSSSGWLRIGGLLEHPAVEVQPGQLAVDEALRAVRQARQPEPRSRAGPAEAGFPLSEQ